MRVFFGFTTVHVYRRTTERDRLLFPHRYGYCHGQPSVRYYPLCSLLLRTPSAQFSQSLCIRRDDRTVFLSCIYISGNMRPVCPDFNFHSLTPLKRAIKKHPAIWQSACWDSIPVYSSSSSKRSAPSSPGARPPGHVRSKKAFSSLAVGSGFFFRKSSASASISYCYEP